MTRVNAVKTQNMFAMRNMMRPVSLIQAPMRTFASFEQIEGAIKKLDKALEGEIKYENDNY